MVKSKMRRFNVKNSKAARVATVCAVAILTAGAAQAADSTYIAARAGIYLPNGRDGGDYKGLKYFDTGYDVEVAAGYRPVSYAAIEMGTGLYTASGKVNTADFAIDRTVYGVPVTLTAKGILEFEKLQLSAGAGIGYYQTFLDNKISFTNGTIASVDQSNHGSALGYQAVFDADFKVSDHWQVGANFKWFSARPEIELQNPNAAGTAIVTTKDKWEVGGTTVNLGVKYSF